jgi:hypothetical protein
VAHAVPNADRTRRAKEGGETMRSRIGCVAAGIGSPSTTTEHSQGGSAAEHAP